MRILDEAGNPLAGQALSYRVDGGERVNGTTDDNGFLRIRLAEGAHGIRLADHQQEIYVSNYSGLGLAEDALRAWPQLTFLADGSCDPVEEPEEEDPEEPGTSEEPGASGDPEDTEDPEDQKDPSGSETEKPDKKPAEASPVEGESSGDPVKPADTGDTGYGAALLLLPAALAAAALLFGIRKRKTA